MFLLLLTWFAAAQFNNEEIKNVVANALSDAASKKSRKIDEFEKEMLPGTYVIGQWIIELAHPLTGPTAREIQGYSTSPNYYAIVVDKSKVYDSSTVITDPKEQKYYILEEEVHKVELDTDLQHRKEVRVFNKKEIDKMKVFTRVQMRSHFDVKANERGDLCSIDSSGAECAKDFSYNWDEKTDKPQLKEVMGIKVGVGAISSFSFDVDLDLFWIGFFCQVKLGANIKAGAAIEIPKVIEIGSIALFEKSFNLLNGLTSISLFGTSVGLTLNISLTGSIEDIKITLGKEFNYFKGYEVTASKVYTISSESGFQQSDWITTAGSIGDDFNLAESIKDLLSEIMLHAKPTLSFGITLAVEWGDPIVSVQVSFDFSVPISFGINSKLCSMPYLAGSIGFSFDIVLTIPEITLMDITIFDEFKESIHVFDIDSGQMCLFDPKLNIEEKDDDYITKVFKNDNLVYLEIDADQHVTYNFIVEISTDQVNIKRDLIYVELQKGESRQLSPITIDKANDPSVKVYTQEWENDYIKTTLIFSKHLGVMNDKEDLTEKVTNCKLTLIKIACKDVDFGKYISRDTSVGALTFKVPVTKGVYQYLPISFNDKVTACGIPYYPIYSSLTTVQENNAGLIESQPGPIFKLKITAINIKKSLLQLQLTRFTSGNDGNPFFSVNLKDKSPGKQNLQDLGINPEAEYFHVSGKLEALFQSDKYTLQESPSLDLSKEQSGTHEFQTEYGSITISYEPVSEYDITFLYSQPQSMMIARYLNGYYMPPSYDNDFGWTYSENIPIDSPNNQEQLNPNVKYVVLGIGIDAESAMPDNFIGYIVLHVPGWTVLSKDSHEIKDGIFVVYINPSVGNHINTEIDGHKIYIPIRRKKTVTDTQEKIYAYGPFKLNSKGSPFCDPNSTYSFETNDYARLGCIAGNDEYNFIDSANEIDNQYHKILKLADDVKVIQNMLYNHSSSTKSTVVAYKSQYEIPSKNSETTFSMINDAVSSLGKKIKINILSKESDTDLLCLQDGKTVEPISKGLYEIDPLKEFVFHKKCKSNEQAFCYQTLNLKGDKNGKWFSVITYPDTNGIIPVEANSELGRGFKYDVVANYDKVDFSKISVGAISVKTYSSSSSNNIKINVKKGSVVRQQHKSSKSSKSIRAENNQTSFYTNVCYSIDNNPIPVKRSAYLSDPINYAIQVGFDVKEAEFDPSNLEIDSNGCLTIYTYKLETPNKDKIMELTGIKDFVKGAEVSVSGEYDNIFTPPEEEDTNITLDSNSTDGSGSGSGSGSGGDGSNTDNEEPKSKAPLIAGVVVAVIVVIGVVVGILVYFLVIRKRRESSLSSNNTGNEDL